MYLIHTHKPGYMNGDLLVPRWSLLTAHEASEGHVLKDRLHLQNVQLFSQLFILVSVY